MEKGQSGVERIGVRGGALTAAVLCYGMQEAEDSLDDWAQSLTELATMKTDLSQYIIADDVLLLQEQVENLHCQWDELCLKVGTHGSGNRPGWKRSRLGDERSVSLQAAGAEPSSCVSVWVCFVFVGL